MSEKKLRCALYLRVSTSDQNCSMQLNELKEYCEKRNWLIHKVYEDKASGTTPNRKMLAELMNDCRKGRVDVVACYRLDRLFRNLKGIILTLAEWNELGISFLSLHDGLDMTTPTGRLLMHMTAAFAEFEASVTRMRVASGLAAARARGVRIGRPSKIHPDLIDAVKKLRSSGSSIRQTARSLSISKTTVLRICHMDQNATVEIITKPVKESGS